MKYRKGDKVKVGSREWYEDCRDFNDHVMGGDGEFSFTKDMSKFCGCTVTIIEVIDKNYHYYKIEEDSKSYYWQDWMFEGLSEGITPERMKREAEDSSTQFYEAAPANFETKLTNVLEELKTFLLDKHSKYGSFYENPPNILTNLSPKTEYSPVLRRS